MAETREVEYVHCDGCLGYDHLPDLITIREVLTPIAWCLGLTLVSICFVQIARAVEPNSDGELFSGALCAFAFLGAFGCALWAVVVVGLTIWRNVIGRTVYAMLDRRGVRHVHREYPTHHVAGTVPHLFIVNDAAYAGQSRLYELTSSTHGTDGREFCVEGPILQLRHGGWFRKCVVSTHGEHRGWTVRSWNWWQVYATDWHGQTKGPYVPEDLIPFLAQYETFDQMDRELRRGLVAIATREDVVRTLVTMELVLDALRTTAGRSAHGKALRKMVEERLHAVSEGDEETRERIIRLRMDVAPDVPALVAKYWEGSTAVAPAPKA